MGTWCAYEFALLARADGKPDPTVLIASAFPSPSLPVSDRPWNVCDGMDDAAFKTECRGWSINEIIFKGNMWDMRGRRAARSSFDESRRRRDADGFRGDETPAAATRETPRGRRAGRLRGEVNRE